MTDTLPWYAQIEFRGPADDDAEAIADLLIDDVPCDSASFGPGHLAVRVSLDTTGDYSAAVADVETVISSHTPAGWVVAGIEIQREDLLETELAQPLIPELVGIGETAVMLRITQKRAFDVACSEAFPPPVMTLASGPLFLRSAVLAFVDRHGHTIRPSKKVVEHMEMLRTRVEEANNGNVVPVDWSLLSGD